MPADPSVLAALAAAVRTDPENAPLRLHLAEMLMQAGRAPEALDQCVAVLAKHPAHPEALPLAARAAEQAGDKIRADGYRRLHQALSWDQAKSMVETVSPSLPPPDDLPPPAPVPLRLSQDEDAEDGERFFETERPEITLSDVAGMEQVKRRLNMAFLAPMKNPDMRKLYGKSLRGGLLLYGPPGCGKTYIARATAGELGARFIAIGLADVLDMYLGQAERNLRAIFDEARRHSPCVLFFDEIDALGRKRSLMRESFQRNSVNQLLTEMDSVAADNEGVFVLAATNHPWDVDTALRRPGRLDRTLLVLPPDAPARAAILRRQMEERPTENLDYANLAARTEDFSGADVVHVCESATELAMEDSLESGNARPVRMRDFERALKEVHSSTRPWFDTARNYAQFANEGGTYDDLLDYLRAHKMT